MKYFWIDHEMTGNKCNDIFSYYRSRQEALKSALNNSGPEITIDSIFAGDKALSQVRRICMEKNVIFIESNAFMNYWYPGEASNMILDIINEITPMRKVASYLTGKYSGLPAAPLAPAGVIPALNGEEEINLTGRAQ